MSNLLSKLNSNALALVLLPVLVVPLVFYNTTLAMAHVWTVNETFTHGFLVFPLVIWLVWRNRSQLLSIRPNPEPWALLILVALLFVWLIGAAVDVEIVQQFSMVSIIIASIWLIAGRQVLSYILFPLLFLYFAVPFGQALIPPLMDLTANFTVALIRMVGLPVFQDGLSFSLPTGSWAVVEECSGVRYLIASFLLGSIYAYLNYSSTKKRVIFILLSLFVPVVGNSLRAFGIVMIGHYSGMKLALGVDHLVYGWLFFGVIIFLLFYAGSFWRDPEDSFEIAVEKDDRFIATRKNSQPLVFVVITFLLVVSFSVFSHHIENEKLRGLRSVALQLPESFSDWKYDAGRSLSWQPIYLRPDAKVSRIYSAGDDFVQLNIAYFQAQRQGAEAISSSNKITDPYEGDWKIIRSARIVQGDKVFTESEIKYAKNKLLIWSWYRVGEHEVASPYKAKALEAYNLIIEGRADASLLSVAIVFDENKKEARQKLYDFWKKSATGINNELERLQHEK